MNTISIQELLDGKPGKVVAFAYPTLSQGTVLNINNKGKVFGTFSIREGNVFHRIRSYNQNMCLFMTSYANKKDNNIDDTEEDADISPIELVIGTEKISAYNNDDGYAQTSITVTPTFMANGIENVSVNDDVKLITKFELLKYFINYYYDKNKVKCELSLESLHEFAKSLYSKLAPNEDYSQLKWRTEAIERVVKEKEKAEQADPDLIEALKNAEGRLLSRKRQQAAPSIKDKQNRRRTTDDAMQE